MIVFFVYPSDDVEEIARGEEELSIVWVMLLS